MFQQSNNKVCFAVCTLTAQLAASLCPPYKTLQAGMCQQRTSSICPQHRASLVDPAPAYRTFSTATVAVKGSSFRTKAYERNMKYANCGVAAVMRNVSADSSSSPAKYYGKIQTIFELPVPDESKGKVYFKVNWYKKDLVTPDPQSSMVHMVKATGSRIDWDLQQPYILASNVEHQVFFASLPSRLWVMRYVSSATVMPDVCLF